MDGYDFIEAGTVRLDDIVLTREGDKLFGECRIQKDELRCRNSHGEEFWASTGCVLVVPPFAIAVRVKEGK